MTITTIKIETETREALKTLGRKRDTYDMIVLRLIAAVKKNPYGYEDILKEEAEAPRRSIKY